VPGLGATLRLFLLAAQQHRQRLAYLSNFSSSFFLFGLLN
jgi:hypothetical protein